MGHLRAYQASPESLRLEVLEGLSQGEDARGSCEHRERGQQGAEPGAVLEQGPDVVSDAINDLAACGGVACAGAPCVPTGCDCCQIHCCLHPASQADPPASQHVNAKSLPESLSAYELLQQGIDLYRGRRAVVRTLCTT